MLAVLALVASLHTDSINLVAGDRSAELGYVAAPTEQARIRGHLGYAHDVLAARDVRSLSPELRAARAKNLARLRAYAAAGQFPRNDGHPDARRPTFVDEGGDICAVGALYAADRGFAEAVRISRAFKYAFIPEIVDADLHAWQRTSGLSADELALIQPAYGREPDVEPDDRPPPPKLHVLGGLTDRMQLGPARYSLAMEASEADAFDSLRTTIYVHARVSRRAHAYVAMPTVFALDRERPPIAAAGGEPMPERPAFGHGNADVGVFVGREDRGEGTAALVRFGALLPTATAHEAAPGIRAGDFVQELPRSFGGRISTSRMVGWKNRSGTVGYAVRFDAGFDYARATAAGPDGKHAQFFVPRANLGLLVRKPLAAVSFDTTVAHVFDDDVDGRLRWSGGTTIRLTTPCGFQPGLTLAAVRDPEGWGAAFALDIAMAPR